MYIHDWLSFTTQSKQDRSLPPCLNQTHILLLDLWVVFLAEGRRRLHRWFFSCSTSLCSDWADDPDQTWSLGRFLNTCQVGACYNRPGTKSKPLWYHSCRIPDTKLLQTHFTPFSFLCASFKDSFHWFKEVFKSKRQQRDIKRRGSLCRKWTVTPGSRKRDVRRFLPPEKKYHQQLTALLTLECSPFVRFQI